MFKSTSGSCSKKADHAGRIDADEAVNDREHVTKGNKWKWSLVELWIVEHKGFKNANKENVISSLECKKRRVSGDAKGLNIYICALHWEKPSNVETAGWNQVFQYLS